MAFDPSWIIRSLPAPITHHIMKSLKDQTLLVALVESLAFSGPWFPYELKTETDWPKPDSKILSQSLVPWDFNGLHNFSGFAPGLTGQ